ncbi:MAG: VWA domain-containing protein, partial [Halobacteriota archaeon]|nr:VWA domain-containing protein [Halobacteriota archaeon]
MLRDEIRGMIEASPLIETRGLLFEGFQLDEGKQEEVISTLHTGHHLLILGPPGCGKTVLAEKICRILGDIEVIKGCPVNCSPDSPECPWCLGGEDGLEIEREVMSGFHRVKRVQGSPELVPEDLIGVLDPDAAAFEYGIYDIRAFTPGKLLRANRGILILDFIDRIPERVLNVLLYALEGDTITIGSYEERIPLDILILATGGERVLRTLSLDMIDHFDIIRLDYIDSVEKEREIIVQQEEWEGEEYDKALEIVRRTREHSDLQRGVSTRGGIKFSELIEVHKRLKIEKKDEIIRRSSVVSLPHRVEIAPHAEAVRTTQEIIEEIVEEVISGEEKGKELVTLSKEDVLSLVEEIAKEDRLRKPLKLGFFDLLLKRIQRFPDTKLAKIHKEMMGQMEELYVERDLKDNITQEMLEDIEERRKQQNRLMEEYKKTLEKEALQETLALLERRSILERDKSGWNLSRKGITFLLEKLSPRLWENVNVSGEGKHKTGKKLTTGEGRIVGVRKYRYGDRYKDVSLKDTIREVIRNRRDTVTKEDIMVTKKDIRTKMDIILIVDLSGTMSQLEKLWYAKESAIALSMASAKYKDRLGVVSFSNLADIVVEITDSPYRVTEKILDLDLHENAFTNIGYGLLKARSVFMRQRKGDANQHIILISDGDATAPHPSPEKYAIREAIKTARKGITISCVCINEESANPELMKKISRIGKGRIYMIGEAGGITSALLEERSKI